jgi:heme-degrading monooxygenase HmoA
MTVVVMVSARIKPGTRLEFERAFRQVSDRVRGTEGHLEDRLLRAHDDEHSYILMGTWRSASDFQAWEDAPVHREVTTPMRPFWNGPVTRTIHEVVAQGAPAGHAKDDVASVG